MDLKNFLESGLLESYILQQCTPEESKFVENMLKRHPEVVEEKLAIELSLERMARSESVEPPEWMKVRVQRVVEDLDESSTNSSSALISDKIVWWTLSTLIIAGGILLILYLLEKDKMKTLHENSTKMQVQWLECEENTERMGRIQAQMALLYHTSTQKVELKALDTHLTHVHAVVFNNPEMRRAMIGNLQVPPLTDDQDYQLWVIVEGNENPVALNIFSFNSYLEEPGFIEYFDNTIAFAISIEPKGGSRDGTPSQVVMMGTIE
ncbi:MAG TPA: anti-sigma factor [Saprospiraceae bacterium]|nr:anti-sigma factor [Saprospiraceae bacterium]